MNHSLCVCVSSCQRPNRRLNLRRPYLVIDSSWALNCTVYGFGWYWYSLRHHCDYCSVALELAPTIVGHCHRSRVAEHRVDSSCRWIANVSRRLGPSSSSGIVIDRACSVPIRLHYHHHHRICSRTSSCPKCRPS